MQLAYLKLYSCKYTTHRSCLSCHIWKNIYVSTVQCSCLSGYEWKWYSCKNTFHDLVYEWKWYSCKDVYNFSCLSGHIWIKIILSKNVHISQLFMSLGMNENDINVSITYLYIHFACLSGHIWIEMILCNYVYISKLFMSPRVWMKIIIM